MITQEEIKEVLDEVAAELGEEASDKEVYAKAVVVSICKKKFNLKTFTSTTLNDVLDLENATTEELMTSLVKELSGAKIKLDVSSDGYNVIHTNLSSVQNLAGQLVDVYNAAIRYEADNPVTASKCLSEIYSSMSTILGMVGPDFSATGLMSIQFDAARKAMDKGTEVMCQHTTQLDEILDLLDEEELDADDAAYLKNLMKDLEYSGCIDEANAVRYYMMKYDWFYNYDTEDMNSPLYDFYSMYYGGAGICTIYNRLREMEDEIDYAIDNNIQLDTQKMKDAESTQRYIDPLILDLDGDGQYSKSVEEGVYFDYNGDGFAEKTSWATEKDGLLVRDLDDSGTIENGTELFGDQTVLKDGTIATTGFEALKIFVQRYLWEVFFNYNTLCQV